MTCFVIRHAHAGQRAAWDGDDSLRPLSARGRDQAEGIADELVDLKPRRIIASNAVRCRQTVEPLAERLGLDIEDDHRIHEGASAADAASLVDELDGTPIALCSHGDVIPHLLSYLVDCGLRPERNLVWQKASVWVAERDGDDWTVGRYLGPPDRA